jgi:hypothetical protein
MREVLLSTLAEQPWIEILGEVPEEEEILGSVQKMLPDLLVIAAIKRGKRPHICDALFEKYPKLGIIAIAPTENYSVCYWASPEIHSFDIETSEEGLLDAVRRFVETAGRLA